MSVITRLALSALVVFLVCGCGGEGGSSGTHAVRFDVGGFVAYQGEPSTGLAGVAVTLVDAAGDSFTATTGSGGLWTIGNVEPGIFTERYELAGYDPVTGAFALEAFGENDVRNSFVARPTLLLEELRLRATVMPFGVDVEDTSALLDGVGNQVIVYDDSVDGAISVVFPQAVTSGFLVLEDQVTGEFAFGVLDSNSMAQFIIADAALDGLNAGAGLTTDTIPSTTHRLSMLVNAYTPIHGEPVSVEATVEFNAVP